jgi:A/G-specific adenine glycosylase
MCFNIVVLHCKKKESRSVTGVSLRDKVRNRYFNYLVVADERNTVIQKKKFKRVWQNL